MLSACAPTVRVGPARQESAWLAYLGSPRHDAAARETLNPDPRPLWHTGLGRGARGSPAIAEAVIAVGTADRNVTLVDRTSGAVIWRSRLDGTVRAGPLLDADRLYIGSEAQPDGRVYALRLRDGKILWRARTGSVAAPLAFDGEALYAGTEDGVALRLEPERGRIQWRAALAGAIRSGPLVTPYGVVVATTGDSLYLIDRNTGTVHQRLRLPGTVLGTAATDGKRAYLGTVNGRIVAVDLASWTIAWDRAAGDAVYGAPALVDETLFVLARNGRLWLIPVHAPDSARSHALDIVSTAGPTPLASGVLVGSVSGEVLLVDPSTGAIRWRAQVAGPIDEPPLVRDRQVVVIAGRGNIHTYR
jgi:outer membrane protein assembly factor BamB